jgi:hypothetical protein
MRIEPRLPKHRLQSRAFAAGALLTAACSGTSGPAHRADRVAEAASVESPAAATTPAQPPAPSGWSWKSFSYFRDATFNKHSHKLVPDVHLRFDQPSVWKRMGFAIRVARDAPHNNGLRDSSEELRGQRGCIIAKFNERSDIDSESCPENMKHYAGLDIEFVVFAYKSASGPSAVPAYHPDGRLVDHTKDYALLFRKRGVPVKPDGSGSGFFWDDKPAFHDNVWAVGDFSPYDRLKIYTCVHKKPDPAPDRDEYRGIGLQFCVWEDGFTAETCTAPIQEQPYVPAGEDGCGPLLP